MREHPLRLLLAAAAAGIVVLAALAAVLPAPWLYLLFHAVCQQRPDRALWVNGAPMAVCARCFGIYAGAALVLLLPWSRARRWPLIAAIALVLVDVLSEAAGLRPAWTAGRLLTGMFAGAAAMPLLVSELTAALRRGRAV